jgi:MFS transporter, ACS family, hexuronate transporter
MRAAPRGGHGDCLMKIRNLRWYVAGLLMLATTINYLDRQTMAVAVTHKHLHMSDEAYSIIQTAFLVAYGLMHPIAGRIIDWLGTRRGFALAVIWWSIANIGHAFARGVWSFASLRFLLGVGEAGNFPGAIKSVSEWFPPKERAFATGILNVGAGTGAILAPPLVVWIILTYNWQAAFVFTGSVGFLWVAAWLLLYHHPDVHPMMTSDELALIRGGQGAEAVESEENGAVLTEVLRHREMWALMLARFISDPGWYFYLFWLPKYLQTARDFDMRDIALFAWMPYVAADVGSVVGGGLSTHLVRRGLSVLTARKVAMCICAALMPVAIPAVRADSPYVALAFICIATFGHQCWAASLLTLPADLFPKRMVGSAYGLSGGCGIAGAALFTTFVGFMLKFVGYKTIFTIVGCLHPTAAVLVLLLVGSHLRKSLSAPATSPGGFPVTAASSGGPAEDPLKE